MTAPWAYAALAKLAPRAAGRRATDAFSDTRAYGMYPDDVTPLGARTFEIHGSPDIRTGYLWGEDDRPAALLVHGWGADSSSMHSLIPPLRELGYRVAAFDAPAHGVSPGSQATMTQFTAAVGAVLDTLGGVRIIVAHSLGSIAAIAAVAARPQLRVDCIGLIAPTCTLTGVLNRWAERRLPGSVVDLVKDELHRRNGVPVTHWDVVAHGRGLEVPVVVIHDPADPVVPFAEAEMVVAGLLDARLETAPGRGHMGILMAAEVKNLISAFVSEHAAEDEGSMP